MTKPRKAVDPLFTMIEKLPEGGRLIVAKSGQRHRQLIPSGHIRAAAPAPRGFEREVFIQYPPGKGIDVCSLGAPPGHWLLELVGPREPGAPRSVILTQILRQGKGSEKPGRRVSRRSAKPSLHIMVGLHHERDITWFFKQTWKITPFTPAADPYPCRLGRRADKPVNKRTGSGTLELQARSLHG